jgi:hypothetical protein
MAGSFHPATPSHVSPFSAVPQRPPRRTRAFRLADLPETRIIGDIERFLNDSILDLEQEADAPAFPNWNITKPNFPESPPVRSPLS